RNAALAQPCPAVYGIRESDLDVLPPDRARLVHVQRGPGLQGEDGRGQAGQRLVPRCPGAEQQVAAALDEVGDRYPLAGGQTVGREVIDHQDVKSAQGDRRVGNVVWVQM